MNNDWMKDQIVKANDELERRKEWKEAFQKNWDEEWRIFQLHVSKFLTRHNLNIDKFLDLPTNEALEIADEYESLLSTSMAVGKSKMKSKYLSFVASYIIAIIGVQIFAKIDSGDWGFLLFLAVAPGLALWIISLFLIESFLISPEERERLKIAKICYSKSKSVLRAAIQDVASERKSRSVIDSLL